MLLVAAAGPLRAAALHLPLQPLPDAPQPVASRPSNGHAAGLAPTRRPAPRLARYIEHNQLASPLNARTKLELSLHEQIRPYALSTQLLAAGWEHLLDSDPRYGTDSAGFGERLGAAALRQDSSAIFSDGVMAIVFHQDPRYYRLGQGSIGHRLIYSATRIFITRSDSGNPEPNYSRLTGSAGAYALTMAYYPAVSATWSKTYKGYGVSLLTGALGNELHEFYPDFKRLLQHRHPAP